MTMPSPSEPLAELGPPKCTAFCWVFGAVGGLTCQKPGGHKGKHKIQMETYRPTGLFTITWEDMRP